jgi:beta-glucosidase
MAICFLTTCSVANGQTDPAKARLINDRIETLLSKMTLEEKVMLLSGDSTGFNSQGIERLGIPPIKMSDGPVGVRTGLATAYPVSLNMAATWDTALIKRYGIALGEETKAKGKNCILGPCVGIHRYPLGGRNFESFGEDPYLTSRLVVNYIHGVQGQHVIATVKHFACNDQEWERNNYDVIVDDRSLHEIHLAPFEAAVKEGKVWALMTAYNKVNGQYCSENRHLVTDILKGEWRFKGLVMSDWVSVYSAVEAANNGLDIEMPGPMWMKDSLLAALKAGKVTEEVINDKVRRHLHVRIEAGYMDNAMPGEDQRAVETDAHRKLALEMAEKSMVLVKNDGILPFAFKNIKSIAVIGPGAKTARTGGGGSSTVAPWISVSPYEGMTKIIGDKVKFSYAEGSHIDPFIPTMLPGKYLLASDGKTPGLQGEFYNNMEWKGLPVLTRIDSSINFNYGGGSPDPKLPKDNFTIRWTGKLIGPVTGKVRLSIGSDDGSLLYINGKLVIDNGGDHGEQFVSGEMQMEAGKLYDIRIDFFEHGGDAVMKLGWQDPFEKLVQSSFDEAVMLAKEADVAVVCVGNTADYEHEGADIADFKMPGDQDSLVEAIAKVNPNTIVVLYGGNSILMKNWINKVKAIIVAGYPGQEGGIALANILTGKVNPSGKLPYSYIQGCNQSPGCKGYKDPQLKVLYSEGIFVGYRYYEKNNIKPLFPFGFGLSYTNFEFSNLRVTKNKDRQVTVQVDVKNTGSTEGEEVAQIYVSQVKCSVERPLKELKAFARAKLAAGETKTLSMVLTERAFQFWHPQKKTWILEPGEFNILAGNSSQEITLKKTIRL